MSSWASDQLPPCFSDFRWSRSVDPGGHFGPALGSLMSSQSTNFASMGVGLGSGKPVLQRAAVPSEFGSPKLGQLNSANNLAPAFAEVRAARVFRFEGDNFGLGGSHFELNSTSSQPLTGDGFQVEHLESSSQAPGLNGVKLEMKNGELGICREETSMSDPICASGSLGGHRGSNARKRRTHQKSKENEIASPKSVTDPPMVADEEDCATKRHRHTENNAEIASQSDGSRNDEKSQGKEGNVKPSEPPKDYIHVRARRGQATDSHSLAERLRREKISQRMKLLQDLVPGCSKVTGKAVMLDEIINYVQSLQSQVEFLSMKLATVTPDLDFSNLMNLQPEDMIQICGYVPSSVYPFETTMPSSYANQPPQGNPLNRIAANRADSYTLGSTRLQNFNSHRQPCINGYGNVSSQVGAFWEDDLQSVVQIGMGQGQEIVSSSQSFNGGGALSAAEMKTEP